MLRRSCNLGKMYTYVKIYKNIKDKIFRGLILVTKTYYSLISIFLVMKHVMYPHFFTTDKFL